jgi:transposase
MVRYALRAGQTRAWILLHAENISLVATMRQGSPRAVLVSFTKLARADGDSIISDLATENIIL